MACGCNKNRPKVNQAPRNSTIVAKSSQNIVLRVNNVPRPTIQSQGTSNVKIQVNGDIAKTTVNMSPAGLNAHKRQLEARRRAAIRNTFGK